MKAKPLPPLDVLRATFRYEPETGKIYWLVSTSNRIRVGDEAGKLSSSGYTIITFQNARWPAHRIAWALTYGYDPINLIDHEDCDGTNNRLKNLREANKQRNTWNCRISKRNTTGFKGVSMRRGRFVAHIRHNRVLKWLGEFKTAEEAHEAYCREGLRLRGPYFNPGYATSR